MNYLFRSAEDICILQMTEFFFDETIHIRKLVSQINNEMIRSLELFTSLSWICLEVYEIPNNFDWILLSQPTIRLICYSPIEKMKFAKWIYEEGQEFLNNICDPVWSHVTSCEFRRCYISLDVTPLSSNHLYLYLLIKNKRFTFLSSEKRVSSVIFMIVCFVYRKKGL